MNTPACRPFERSQIEQSIYSRFAEQVAQFSSQTGNLDPAIPMDLRRTFSFRLAN
jgi:hypothetical protein